ncbi:hypothetical protein, partial [Paraburkholderia bengalensis]|uniref:hypothetical protein n=1 Tax=Paraburkholderia bengalensis TaxID=2747562 RepID=UPI003014F48A
LSFACFSLPLQRKVGAAPHRGNANQPETKSGCHRKGHARTGNARAAKALSRMPEQKGNHTPAMPAPRRRNADAHARGKHHRQRPRHEGAIADAHAKGSYTPATPAPRSRKADASQKPKASQTTKKPHAAIRAFPTTC